MIFLNELNFVGRFQVTAESMTEEGEPKEVICEVAEQLSADMIIVGSRGLGTIKR